MITLHELLGIEEQEFCKYKVHFAIGTKEVLLTRRFGLNKN